jgi:hypothetical protein
MDPPYRGLRITDQDTTSIHELLGIDSDPSTQALAAYICEYRFMTKGLLAYLSNHNDPHSPIDFDLVLRHLRRMARILEPDYDLTKLSMSKGAQGNVYAILVSSVANSGCVALLNALATSMETHDSLMTQLTLDYSKMVCMRHFVREMDHTLLQLKPLPLSPMAVDLLGMVEERLEVERAELKELEGKCSIEEPPFGEVAAIEWSILERHYSSGCRG